MAKLSSTIIQIRSYVEQLKDLHAQPAFVDVRISMIKQLATERLLLNVSEATRRIPESEKSKGPDVPWQAIADIGNRLRHDYDDVNIEIIQKVLDGNDLDILLAAIELMNPEAEQVRRIHPRPSSKKDED